MSATRFKDAIRVNRFGEVSLYPETPGLSSADMDKFGAMMPTGALRLAFSPAAFRMTRIGGPESQRLGKFAGYEYREVNLENAMKGKARLRASQSSEEDMSANIDLTQRPPRSPRVRLGGYVILPRMLDKGRATIAGKNGEYNFNCPLDQHFLNFVGIDAEGIRQQLTAGKGDGEVLEWITANGKHNRTSPEIAAWSAMHDQRAPADLESRDYFHELHKKIGPQREDVASWFDLLDLDDHVSFGGKA